MSCSALRNLYKTQGYVSLFKANPAVLPPLKSTNVGFAFSAKSSYRIESLVKYYLDEVSHEDMLFLKVLLSKSNSFSAELKKNLSPLVYGINIDCEEAASLNCLSRENVMMIKNLFFRLYPSAILQKTTRYGLNMSQQENLDAQAVMDRHDVLAMAFMISNSCNQVAFKDGNHEETIILKKLS